jgi:MFS family permease
MQLTTFQSLRNYNFRLFWLGQLVSLVGTWMQIVGQSWLVLELTGSPLALGTMAALQFLPISLLTLFAGVLVDRVSKRRLLLCTQSVALAQALALAVLVSSGLVQLWHVYLLAATLGVVSAIEMPARQAFVMEMVGREDLLNAVALNSTLFNGARVLGPAIGGVIIARAGLGTCFFLNAASFVAVLAGLLAMRPRLLHAPVPRPPGRVLRELREGLSYAVHTPAVLLVVALVGVFGTFGYNFTVGLPLLAHDALGLDAEGFGGLTSVMGLGSLVASLVVASLRRTSQLALLLGAAAFSVLLAGLASSQHYLVSLAIIFVLGMASLTFQTSANSLLQLEVPDRLRGRVMSLYILLFLGMTPIGGLLTGAVAQRFGIQLALGSNAVACGVGVLAAVLYRRLAGAGRTEPASPGAADPTGASGRDVSS